MKRVKLRLTEGLGTKKPSRYIYINPDYITSIEDIPQKEGPLTTTVTRTGYTEVVHDGRVDSVMETAEQILKMIDDLEEMRIKVIKASTTDNLETYVNDWLRENKVKIFSVKYPSNKEYYLAVIEYQIFAKS